MRHVIYIFLFFSSFFCLSQENEVPKAVLDKIKNDVWLPFMEAYAELDSDKLKSIHSEDIFRVTIDQNNIQTGQAYLNGFGGYLYQVKSNGGKLGIAFAILTTAIDTSGDLAYQTGYYEFSSKNKDESSLTVKGYGLFNVALRKTDNVWKLFLDSDRRINISLSQFDNEEIVYRLNQ